MNDNNQCGTEKKCPVSCAIKLLMAAVPVALFLMAAEYFIHVKWLMDLYNTTPQLWRTPEDMKVVTGGGMCLLRIAAMSLAIAALYLKTKKTGCPQCAEACKKKCPIAHGLCFGVALGVFMGTMMGSSYFWMPISAELGQKWFLAGLGEGIGAGLVLGIICKCCSKMCGKKSCGTTSCGSKAA